MTERPSRRKEKPLHVTVTGAEWSPELPLFEKNPWITHSQDVWRKKDCHLLLFWHTGKGTLLAYPEGIIKYRASIAYQAKILGPHYLWSEWYLGELGVPISLNKAREILPHISVESHHNPTEPFIKTKRRIKKIFRMGPVLISLTSAIRPSSILRKAHVQYFQENETYSFWTLKTLTNPSFILTFKSCSTKRAKTNRSVKMKPKISLEKNPNSAFLLRWGTDL